MTAKLWEQDVAEPTVIARSFADILNKSFFTALLLTGNAIQAEQSVIEAIDVWDQSKESNEQIFQITLRMAVEKQVTVSPAGVNNECDTAFCLPIELRRVLELAPRLRSCFVLRVLVGLPSPLCAQLLRLSPSQIDRHSRKAIRSLIACCQQVVSIGATVCQIDTKSS